MTDDPPVEFHESLGNTSLRVRQLADDGAPHGTMVVANELTAARGRTGNEWAAPPGGIWSSTLLRPDLSTEHVGRLTFAGAMAVVDAVEPLGVDARLKWPNDVVVASPSDEDAADAVPKKLAGILTEPVVDGVTVPGKPVDEVFGDDNVSVEYVLVGTGINADFDPAEVSLDRPVTTLRAEVGSVDRERVAERYRESLVARCDAVESDEGFAALLDDWRERAETLGSRVTVRRRGDTDVTGIARDVSPRGGLLVETDERTVELTEGETTRLRNAPR
ncbi:biotin--[acetyl-CoA-carboxylase] ligase [Halogeometricum borinquense]|uniref:Biotin--[acetyl-CoA-carboxylase] ligase n=1 Tax=Halogeometricum borinquense TaxID=60847 RepID=A0A6C0UGH2_9EURY|nr:biotin--[acetyl-CoA-carboxylase] ligase [Halogeometricum borinquense]QIB73663.1 biotin--[acetyl-CoA-carboxylase] ligase [Halogeometricum borinquense]QIQ76981.1 biotin--[acetyl-CoA-carboxylase] ligase [Halogeometricum borinquense]